MRPRTIFGWLGLTAPLASLLIGLLAPGAAFASPVTVGVPIHSSGSVTINNAYAKANSIVFVTVASNAASLVPIRVATPNDIGGTGGADELAVGRA